jgi:hypothetical protein
MRAADLECRLEVSRVGRRSRCASRGCGRHERTQPRQAVSGRREGARDTDWSCVRDRRCDDCLRKRCLLLWRLLWLQHGGVTTGWASSSAVDSQTDWRAMNAVGDESTNWATGSTNTTDSLGRGLRWSGRGRWLDHCERDGFTRESHITRTPTRTNPSATSAQNSDRNRRGAMLKTTRTHERQCA